jgi:putative NADH-flavin reductase
MSQLPTVGVAGANGRLGRHVINALISPAFKSNFGGVVALVRESADRSTINEKNGVEVRVYSEENMVGSLKGIDILINVYAFANLLTIASLRHQLLTKFL